VSKQVVIGITDCEKYSNYEKWILAEPDVMVIQLGAKFSNSQDVEKCNGILITGGEDIHPGFYGKEINYPNAPSEFEIARDEFEIEIFKRAQQNKLPVLGICRGLQLINCVLGGTLKQDLGKLNDTHTRVSKDDKIHEVTIDASSMLFRISNVSTQNVNSSHHQSIDKLGEGLKINCVAEDGTIEGIEGPNLNDQFLLAVQWHPERMLDQSNPLSKNIKKSFLQHCLK
jgi:putative glutamine amidotransferase